MGQDAQVTYGVEDATFQAAGGEEGIARLVDCFYRIMAENPAYRKIFDWHPDGDTARDKLSRFLCGWMGGPRRYQEKYGSIRIPVVHSHLDIGVEERDMWLNCMQEALEEQPYPESLKTYLRKELGVPAERIRVACAKS